MPRFLSIRDARRQHDAMPTIGRTRLKGIAMRFMDVSTHSTHSRPACPTGKRTSSSKPSQSPKTRMPESKPTNESRISFHAATDSRIAGRTSPTPRRRAASPHVAGGAVGDEGSGDGRQGVPGAGEPNRIFSGGRLPLSVQTAGVETGLIRKWERTRNRLKRQGKAHDPRQNPRPRLFLYESGALPLS